MAAEHRFVNSVWACTALLDRGEREVSVMHGNGPQAPSVMSLLWHKLSGLLQERSTASATQWGRLARCGRKREPLHLHADLKRQLQREKDGNLARQRSVGAVSGTPPPSSSLVDTEAETKADKEGKCLSSRFAALKPTNNAEAERRTVRTDTRSGRTASPDSDFRNGFDHAAPAPPYLYRKRRPLLSPNLKRPMPNCGRRLFMLF